MKLLEIYSHSSLELKMRISVDPKDPATLQHAIEQGTRADYVYMYPPRQAYYRLGDNSIEGLVESSLAASRKIGIYLHFPFCRQICSFCNLFADASGRGHIPDEYIVAILGEIKSFSRLHGQFEVQTVYFGGGTPSLMSARQFELVMQALEEGVGLVRQECEEISMEVAPDTVDLRKMVEFVKSGLTRINLGVQSFNDDALADIGRKHGVGTILRALDESKEAGVQNISVDLIYGIPDQTLGDWISSVSAAVATQVETICLYPYTSRPFTSFFKRGDHSDPDRYQKFSTAFRMMEADGYDLETHVRYVRRNSKGGYVQKKNHWGLGNIIGFGAGARSYLWEVDKRNGYSVKNRRRPIEEYIQSISHGAPTEDKVFIMDSSERKRKAISLNIHDLDIGWYFQIFGTKPEEDFPEELMYLRDGGFVNFSDGRIRIVPRFIGYRDSISQLFFSDRVRQLVASFDYNE